MKIVLFAATALALSGAGLAQTTPPAEAGPDADRTDIGTPRVDENPSETMTDPAVPADTAQTNTVTTEAPAATTRAPAPSARPAAATAPRAQAPAARPAPARAGAPAMAAMPASGMAGTPERDARGIPVVSGSAMAPNGANMTPMAGARYVPAPNQAAAFASRPSEKSYTPCTREVTDGCVQTYERGRAPK